MERKAPRQPRKYKNAAVLACLSMIQVDGARIRTQIKNEYEKISHDLAKAREQLHRFEKYDAPEYSRWVHRQFGALLTELRATSARIHQLAEIFNEVQAEIFFSGDSPGRAYARVMRDRKKAEHNPEEDSDEDDFESESRESGSRPSSDDEGEGPEFEEFFHSHSRTESSREHRAPVAIRARLKELYRALARRLHPDAQGQMTAQKKEWWHQAQSAYDQGDLEQLEVILCLCDIEETGTTEKTSLSVLQRISRQLKTVLRQVRSQLSKHRQDPAWNFQRRKDKEMLAVTTRLQLEHDLHLLNEELQEMEMQLAALARPSASPRPRRYSRRAPVAGPFEAFF